MTRSTSQRPQRESGRLGLAILIWLLGVPGIVVMLYLIFGR
jgi:hypothetical protein